MKHPTKEEMAGTINSLDISEFDATPLPTMGRSEGERAANCPFMAHAVAKGLVNDASAPAESGNEVHQAYSNALAEWIGSGGDMEPHDLRANIEFDLANARPDIQPDVLTGGRSSMWAWCSFIRGIHPDNILAYDGGESQGRGGQLAWDMPDLGVRVTSEIDLLLAGDSVQTVREIDYKSGWKVWTASEVKRSFQFQMHAALILRAYPSIEAVLTEVWNTRSNSRTYPVEFARKNLNDYEMRIRRTVEAWKASQGEHPACWPGYEKCSMCPAAIICPEASADIKAVAEDPKAAVLRLVAIDAQRDALAKLLNAHVKRIGSDIVVGDAAYGCDKPKVSRKTWALYPVNSKSDSNPEE